MVLLGLSTRFREVFVVLWCCCDDPTILKVGEFARADRYNFYVTAQGWPELGFLGSQMPSTRKGLPRKSTRASRTTHADFNFKPIGSMLSFCTVYYGQLHWYVYLYHDLDLLKPLAHGLPGLS